MLYLNRVYFFKTPFVNAFHRSNGNKLMCFHFKFSYEKENEFIFEHIDRTTKGYLRTKCVCVNFERKKPKFQVVNVSIKSCKHFRHVPMQPSLLLKANSKKNKYMELNGLG